MRFFRKKKRLDAKEIIDKLLSKYYPHYDPKLFYKQIWETMCSAIKIASNTAQKSLMIDYYIDHLINEISSSYALLTVHPFYLNLSKDEKPYFDQPRNWFPNYYFDSEHNKQFVITGVEKKDISKAKLIALVSKTDNIPYYLYKHQQNEETFFHDRDCRFLPYLNLCIASICDHHRLSAAKMSGKKVIVSAEIYDITLLFPHVETDGETWIHNTSLKTENEPVFDFRFALLFSLAKMKYELEQQ